MNQSYKLQTWISAKTHIRESLTEVKREFSEQMERESEREKGKGGATLIGPWPLPCKRHIESQTTECGHGAHSLWQKDSVRVTR